MTTITRVCQNIQNFKVPGVIAVLSPNPNFQVLGVIEPQFSAVLKPQKFGVIATPCLKPKCLIKKLNLNLKNNCKKERRFKMNNE